ncbi:MAG TPA: hypothetical protein PLH94_14590 [Fimbriimonadaceae bacterium]|nr:hypothetical protein [Fimbriimonadaceae bacterium]
MSLARTLSLAALVAVLGLGGCGGGGGLTKKPYFVIVGSASGPVLRELQKTYLQQIYRPGQALKGASMLVVDGSVVPADSMDDLKAIDDALGSGVPVLCLNVSKAHLTKAAEGSSRIGAFVNGNHDAYLMTPMAHGIDIVHVGPKKFTRRQLFQHLDTTGHLRGSRSEDRIELQPDQASIDRFVANLKDRLAGKLPIDSVRGTDPPSSIPRYITTVQDSFTSVDDNVVPGQTVTSNVAFFFNVYYNDGGPGNQYQYLIAYATGMSDPGAPSNNSERTKGYFQTLSYLQMNPNPTENGGLLSLISSGPGQSDGLYQVSFGADIQYSAGASSYLWSLSLPPVAQSIPGWFCNTGGVSLLPNAAQTLFWQGSPFNAVQNNWHDGFTYVGGLVLDYYPKSMNPTSTNQLPVNMAAIWRTSTTTDQGIVMQYAAGAQYQLLHAKEKSPGIYDRQQTVINFDPDPMNVTLLFGRAE